jgi:hypothetical protein
LWLLPWLCYCGCCCGRCCGCWWCGCRDGCCRGGCCCSCSGVATGWQAQRALTPQGLTHEKLDGSVLDSGRRSGRSGAHATGAPRVENSIGAALPPQAPHTWKLDGSLRGSSRQAQRA